MTDRTDILNQPQRNHFAVLLAMMEDTLSEIEELADPAGGRHNPFRRGDDGPPPEFANAARPVIAELRGRIESLAATLGIPPREYSRARAIRALVTAEIVRIEDSYAAKLRGYGAVHPDATRVIDPALDDLRARFAELGALLDRAQRPEAL